MSLTPAQLATTWTWFGTGVSTIAAKVVTKKAATKVADTLIKAAKAA